MGKCRVYLSLDACLEGKYFTFWERQNTELGSYNFQRELANLPHNKLTIIFLANILVNRRQKKRILCGSTYV